MHVHNHYLNNGYFKIYISLKLINIYKNNFMNIQYPR
jgi:hypothetical protein